MVSPLTWNSKCRLAPRRGGACCLSPRVVAPSRQCLCVPRRPLLIEGAGCGPWLLETCPTKREADCADVRDSVKPTVPRAPVSQCPCAGASGHGPKELQGRLLLMVATTRAVEMSTTEEERIVCQIWPRASFGNERNKGSFFSWWSSAVGPAVCRSCDLEMRLLKAALRLARLLDSLGFWFSITG